MTRVYVKQLGTTVDVPDGLSPEQTAQHVRSMMPTPEPVAPVEDNTGFDMAAEQQNLQEAQLRDVQAAEGIREAKDIANQNPWTNMLHSAWAGAKVANTGLARTAGETLHKFQDWATVIGPKGNAPEYDWLRGEGAQQMEREQRREKMAYSDPEVDFSKGMWQGKEGEGVGAGLARTIRGAGQEMGPTALMLAYSAPFALTPVNPGYTKAVAALPKFFQTAAKALPGALAMRTFEGAMEGGSTAQEATDRGRTADEAGEAALWTVAGNMPLAAIDVMQATAFLRMLPEPAQKALANVSREYLTMLPMKVLKRLMGLAGAAAGEGMEESIQEEISNWAIGEGFDPQVVWNPIYAREKHPEAFNIGALTSMAQALPHITMETVARLNLDRVNPEQMEAIFKAGYITPEEQEARRDERLDEAEQKAKQELNPENPEASEPELTLAGLERIDPDTIEQIVEDFKGVPDDRLREEALVALDETGPESPVVKAYQARMPEVKAQFRKPGSSTVAGLADNDSDLYSHQAKQDEARKQVEELASDKKFVDETVAKNERREFAELPQAERRQELEIGMQQAAAAGPQAATARIDEAQTANDVAAILADLANQNELDGNTLAYGRAAIDRLGGYQKPGTTAVEIGDVGDTQKSAEVSTTAEQSQTPLAGLPAGEPQATEEAPVSGPFHMDRLRKALGAIAKKVDSIEETATGANVIVDGKVIGVIKGVDLIDPRDQAEAAAAHQLSPSEVGGMPAIVELSEDGSTFEITLARGYDYTTGANVQSLSHEIFHVARKMGILSIAEVASVFQPYVRKALKKMGIKTKVTAKQLLEMDATQDIDGHSVKSILKMVEEGAADGYGNWAPKHQSILDKIWDWLQKMAATDLRDIGATNEAEKVFGKIRSGEAIEAFDRTAVKPSDGPLEAPEGAKEAVQPEEGVEAAPETEEAPAPAVGPETANEPDEPAKKQKGPGKKKPNKKKVEQARRKAAAAAKKMPMYEENSVTEAGAKKAMAQIRVNKKLFNQEWFKEAFGNSVIVDDDGDPLLCAHGTFKMFRSDVPNSGYGALGTHFASAESGITEHFSKTDKKYSRVYPGYLKIENPIYLRDHGEWDVDQVVYEIQENYIEEGEISESLGKKLTDGSVETEEQLVAWLKKAGFDGIVYVNRFELGYDANGKALTYTDYWDAHTEDVDEALENLGYQPGRLGGLEDISVMDDQDFQEIFPTAKESYIVFDPEAQVIPAYTLHKWDFKTFIRPAARTRTQLDQLAGFGTGNLEEQQLNDVLTGINRLERRIKDLATVGKEYSTKLKQSEKSFIDSNLNALTNSINKTKSSEGMTFRADEIAPKVEARLNELKSYWESSPGKEVLAQVKKKHPGVVAAVWTKKKVYTGIAHFEAYEKALDDGAMDKAKYDNGDEYGVGWEDGFLFPDGTFLNRDDTQKRIGIATSEELRAVQAGLKAEDAYKSNEESDMEPTDEELDDLMALAQVRDIRGTKFSTTMNDAQDLLDELENIHTDKGVPKSMTMEYLAAMSDKVRRIQGELRGHVFENMSRKRSVNLINSKLDKVLGPFLSKENAADYIANPPTDVESSLPVDTNEVGPDILEFWREEYIRESKLWYKKTPSAEDQAEFLKTKTELYNDAVAEDEAFDYDEAMKNIEEMERRGEATIVSLPPSRLALPEGKAQVRDVKRSVFNKAAEKAEKKAAEFDWEGNEVAKADLIRAWTFGYLGMKEADLPKTQKQEAERIRIIEDVRQGVRDQYKAQVRTERTAAWKKWFSTAHPLMKDSKGNPILLFHGGFFDIENIDLDKVHIGNYFGRAFYTTTSPEDASENYADREGGDRTAHMGRMMDDIVWHVQDSLVADKPVLNIFKELAETYDLEVTKEDEALAAMLAKEVTTGNYGVSTAADGTAAWAAEKIVYGGEDVGRIYMLNMAASNPLVMDSTSRSGDQTSWTVEIDPEVGSISGEAEAFFDAIREVVEERTDDYSVVEKIMGEIYSNLQENDVDFDGGEITAHQAYHAIIESETMMWEIAEAEDETAQALPMGEMARLIFDRMGYDAVIMDTGVFGGMAKSGTRHFITWKEDNVKTMTAKEPKRGSKNISAQVRKGAIPGKPLFDYWFKGSKVTFNNGDPRPLYHGTVIKPRPPEEVDPKNKKYEYDAFPFFDPDYATVGALGEGFYFASAAYATQGYAGQYYRKGDEIYRAGGAVFQVYMSIKNPYYYDRIIKKGSAEHKLILGTLNEMVKTGEANGYGVIKSEIEYMKGQDFNGHDLMIVAGSPLFKKLLERAGYDGVHAVNDTDFGTPILGKAAEIKGNKQKLEKIKSKPHGDIWVAFYPQQIKSVNNRGTWSPEAAEMLAQVRAQATAGPPGMGQHEFNMAATGMNDPRLNDWFGEKEIKMHEASVLGRQLTMELAKLVGRKALFGLGGYKYGQETRDIAQAIHVYIDMKNEPDAYNRFYKDLSPYQKEIADLAMNKVANSPELVAFANKIERLYDEAGTDAINAGVIHNLRENFVNRIWRLGGKSASESSRTFGTTTRHRRKRKLPTILQGWADGLELTTADAIENLVTYKEEIAKVIEDRALIRQGRITRLDPNDPDSPFLFTHSRPKGHNYAELKHHNFKYYVYDGIEKKGEITEEPVGPGYKFKGRKLSFRKFGVYTPGGKVARKVFNSWDDAITWMDVHNKGDLEIHERWENLREETIYAPAELAENLNKITEEGFTNKTFRKALKYNALIKSWILLTSLFHHMAFARSYWLGTNGKPFVITDDGEIKRGSKANILRAYKDGLRMMDAHTKDIRLLMGEGMTLGRLQDWDIPVGEDQARFSKWMDNHGKTSRKIKNFLGELRQRQTSFLFKNFGAGLKIQSALIELHHNREKYGGQLTDQQIAQLTARLINEDFGGLNFDRMGVSKKTQQVMRFLLLAPDWTGSNFLTLKRLAQNVMGKDPESKVVRDIYARFWAGVIAKGMMATVAANIAMLTLGNITGNDDEDDAWEKLVKAFKDDPTRLQWTGVDITPLYRMLGGTDDGRRRYFSLIGHFKDPMRWALDPGRSLIHKGSPVSRLLLEAIEGKDWKGDGFTTASELLGVDEAGYYKSDGPGYRAGDPKGGQLKGKTVSPRKDDGVLTVDRVPSYLLTQMKGSTPVQVQEFFAVMEGQRTWFDAIARSMGFHMAPGRNTDFDIYNKTIDEFNDELAGLKLTDRKAYAQKRRDNMDLVRASAALNGFNKRIRMWKKKIAIAEKDSKLTADKKKELKEQYEEKIKETEEQFIQKFGSIVDGKR